MNPRTPRIRALAAAAAFALSAAGVALAAPASADPPGGGSDVRDTGADYNKGKPLPFSKKLSETAKGKFSDAYKVGTVRRWPALDDISGATYVKNYRLRGSGTHIEVWVADNLAFPAGDCRNTVGGGALVQVTDQQVAGFINQFDTNMYPRESEAFSVAPSRDGRSTSLTRAYAHYFDLPARNFKGDGGRTVVLVDNVRDQNFYNPTASDGKTFIAGFFYTLFNEYTNRNVMTIDAFDWLHRTGATPPDDSEKADYLACSDALDRDGLGSPRPRSYEGVFAHEYQHLLESYASPGEYTWLNEGLSMFAETLTGYVNPSIDPGAEGANSYAEYLGFSPGFGGPEQSITRWGDQGDEEILADYGAVEAFLLYLHGRFGGDTLTALLHNDADNSGLAALQAALVESGYPDDALDVLHDFLVSMAVDAELDRAGSVLNGGAKDRFDTKAMHARVNWESPDTFDSPGAPTNGADFVELGSAESLTSVEFAGQPSYPATPTEWVEDGGRLYSGSGDGFDRAIARQITVPAASPTVTVGLEWNTEVAWDFAFVQVYDTAAKQWVSLENAATTDVADPDADPRVVANLPGFTGSSGGPTEQTFDLAEYAGKTVWLAIRYITDSAVAEPGVWLDSLSVGGAPVADAMDLGTWSSLTEAVPIPVEGWHVSLVAFTPGGGTVWVSEVPLVDGFNGTLSGAALGAAVGTSASFVAALVTADDSTELESSYPLYSLKANGDSKGA